MQIRLYKTSDKQAVLSLLQQNIPDYFALEELEDLQHYLDFCVEDYFVVLQNQRIIAAAGINYFLDKKMARFSWDVIATDFHGKAIGSALVKHRFKVLEQKAGHIDIIEVRTSQMAFGFYQKMGFTLQQITKDFWAKGFDLYYMTRPCCVSI